MEFECRNRSKYIFGSTKVSGVQKGVGRVVYLHHHHRHHHHHHHRHHHLHHHRHHHHRHHHHHHRHHHHHHRSNNFPRLKARGIIRILTKRAPVNFFPNFTHHHLITYKNALTYTPAYTPLHPDDVILQKGEMISPPGDYHVMSAHYAPMMSHF